MSLLFLGLRSRPLMSIPKSGISQSSLNKLGLLSLSCIIIWIMAFSAIGCNWRFPGNLNLRYLRYLALTSKFDVKNHHVPHQTSHILGIPGYLTESHSTKKWHLASETVPFSRSKLLHIETIAAVVQPFGFGVSISQIHWILSAIHRSITRVAVENPQIPISDRSDRVSNLRMLRIGYFWNPKYPDFYGFLIPKGYSRNQNLPQVW